MSKENAKNFYEMFPTEEEEDLKSQKIDQTIHSTDKLNQDQERDEFEVKPHNLQLLENQPTSQKSNKTEKEDPYLMLDQNLDLVDNERDDEEFSELDSLQEEIDSEQEIQNSTSGYPLMQVEANNLND